MIGIYFDHDSSSAAVVAGLKSAGMAAQTADEAGNRRLTDREQLEYATARDLLIYTANAGDFAALHRSWLQSNRHHSGILVRVPQIVSVGLQVATLHDLCSLLTPEEARDQFFYLANWIARS